MRLGKRKVENMFASMRSKSEKFIAYVVMEYMEDFAKMFVQMNFILKKNAAFGKINFFLETCVVFL